MSIFFYFAWSHDLIVFFCSAWSKSIFYLHPCKDIFPLLFWVLGYAYFFRTWRLARISCLPNLSRCFFKVILGCRKDIDIMVLCLGSILSADVILFESIPYSTSSLFMDNWFLPSFCLYRYLVQVLKSLGALYKCWEGAFIEIIIGVSYRLKVPHLFFQPVVPPSSPASSIHQQPLSHVNLDLPVTMKKGKCSSTAHLIAQFVSHDKFLLLLHVCSFRVFISLLTSFQEAMY